MNHTIKTVSTDSLKVGDTIMLDGQLRTVCKHNLKRDTFMGTSVFGDASKKTTQLVEFASSQLG